MKGPAHDKLWNQLEAEIHLHRHKTVIRACRGRSDPKKPLPSPVGHGGKEHGVPILISEIHPNQPADRCGGLHVGDAILAVNSINLRDAKHKEAVTILSQQVIPSCRLVRIFCNCRDSSLEKTRRQNGLNNNFFLSI
ncbi:hypothetical protein XENOCAPTIV_006456 [Xenoophorus captivus]|uniref:PDZ domain-containing protein n=1 Tax=Xenoophorus captivus TaxID=1517983 RepID=A0ABV0RFW4_9TELE